MAVGVVFDRGSLDGLFEGSNRCAGDMGVATQCTCASMVSPPGSKETTNVGARLRESSLG